MITKSNKFGAQAQKEKITTRHTALQTRTQYFWWASYPDQLKNLVSQISSSSLPDHVNIQSEEWQIRGGRSDEVHVCFFLFLAKTCRKSMLTLRDIRAVNFKPTGKKTLTSGLKV